MSEMSYRANFWMWSVIHTISLLTLIVFFNAIYQNTNEINGWTKYQTLLVTGIGTLITGLGSLTFFPFMYGFSGRISKGLFDTTLTKPLNILFQSAIVWVDMEDLIVTPNSIIFIIYALAHLDIPNIWASLPVFLLLIICSLTILFSLMTVIQSLAFKAVKINSADNFYWSIVNTSKYPAKAIKNVSLIALIWLAPIAIISSVPAEVLMGRFDWPWIVASVLTALAAFLISTRIFHSAVRNYSSASS